jgi:hypothetical protein
MNTAPCIEKPCTAEDNATVLTYWPERVRRALFLIILLQVLLGLSAHVLRFGFGAKSAFGFITLFDLNREGNIPTWFSVILMVLCALLLALIAAARRSSGDRWFRHWAGLGMIFALMSIDEFTQLHERVMFMLNRRYDFCGLLTNAWVLPAFVFLALLAIVYARFLLALPGRSCRWFILSGAVYISGVVGIEMISGLMKRTHGMESLGFALSTTLEETLEMTGLALFIYALLDYAARQRLEWRLCFRSR